jgi:hypothetical protein
MACPLRRFDDAKLQASPIKTTETSKQLNDRLLAMKAEREKQDTMWLSDPKEDSFSDTPTRNGASANTKEGRKTAQVSSSN